VIQEAEAADVGVHRIGHRGSETPLAVTRELLYDRLGKSERVLLVDLPGEKDTSQQLDVLLLNTFIKAFILQRAASLRLILMMQIDQLNTTRGTNLPSDLCL